MQLPPSLSPAIRFLIPALLLCGLTVFKTPVSAQRAGSSYTPSKPIVLNGVHHKIISNLSIKGYKADCIRLINCSDVTIKNCRLYSSAQNGINIINSKKITVTNCYFINTVTGVYAYQSSRISIVYNQFKNMLGPIPKGQMVQFNEVYGGGNRVSFNKCQNAPGIGNPEDAINMYKTNGTATNPVQIRNNQIRGGGRGASGGGIMLGDNGGSYQLARNNILVNPGQYGMAIAGGTHMSITRNKIYARQQPFTNVGIYVWSQHSTTGCALNTVCYNQVNYTNAAGKQNDGWDKGNCGIVIGWATNVWAAPVNDQLLPAIIVK